MREEYQKYEDSYISGYIDALEDMQRRQQARRQRKKNMQEHRRYFVRQRILGAAVLLFTILAVWASDGDATIALVTVPLGLTLVFSRQKIITNDSY